VAAFLAGRQIISKPCRLWMTHLVKIQTEHFMYRSLARYAVLAKQREELAGDLLVHVPRDNDGSLPVRTFTARLLAQSVWHFIAPSVPSPILPTTP
jgi:hypothetical protein